MRRGEESYALSNLRFAVHERFNHCDVYSRNPDSCCPWDRVEFVTCFAEVGVDDIDEFSCPICLQYPCAARIAKCGHLLCLSCVFAYLNCPTASGCPVCKKPFSNVKELRICHVQPVQRVEVGQEVTLKLLLRCSDDVALWAADEFFARGEGDAIPGYKMISSMFSRYYTVNDECRLESLRRDATDLEQRLKDVNEEETKAWLHSSIDYLNQEFSAELEGAKRRKAPETARGFYGRGGPARGRGGRGRGKEENRTVPAFAIYGLANGHYTFLHGVNMKMLAHNADPAACSPPNSIPGEPLKASDLVHVNGNAVCAAYITKITSTDAGLSESRVPLELRCKVLQVEEVRMDEENRRRFKHLSFLPTRASFTILECDMSPFVDSTTQALFAEELSRRSSIRDRKDEQERQERARTERQHRNEVEKRKKMLPKVPDITAFPQLGATAPPAGVEEGAKDSFWTTAELMSAGVITAKPFTPPSAPEARPAEPPAAPLPSASVWGSGPPLPVSQTSLSSIQSEQTRVGNAWGAGRTASDNISWGKPQQWGAAPSYSSSGTSFAERVKFGSTANRVKNPSVPTKIGESQSSSSPGEPPVPEDDIDLSAQAKDKLLDNLFGESKGKKKKATKISLTSFRQS